MIRDSKTGKRLDPVCKAVRLSEDDNRELCKYLIDDKLGFQQWCHGQIQKYLERKRKRRATQ